VTACVRDAAPQAADDERIRAAVGAVTDPEIPVLTLADLGVIRQVGREPGGLVIVRITPTYSGCPAVDTMREDIIAALGRAGYPKVRVDLVLSPAWTTDWITGEGRAKLTEYGIAPPRPPVPAGQVRVALRVPAPVPCPHCGSTRTRTVSRFGSTACKALMQCRECLEPFDHFKELI
jgi:ring-1,2-phenylacetyl-CoA epoxidase subunit PaaD